MNTKKSNTIAYIRSSTEEQEPELQLRDIQTLSPPSDIVIVMEKLSAWKENVKRPELDKLISLISNGQVSAIYVWSLDRLYRNYDRLISFLSTCKDLNVKVYSYNQRWLESIQQLPEPMNKVVFQIMLQLLGWIAEAESSTKSKRVKMAVVKKPEGTFSYKNNKWGRKAFPKQTLSRVLELHKEGKSIRQIAASVQVYDKHNNGRPISKSAVHKIIGQHSLQKDSKSACPSNDQIVDTDFDNETPTAQNQI